jgi:DHA2 family multidrug resistance protein
VSIAQNTLAWREQFHQSRLVEHVIPSDPGYQEALAAATRYFTERGASLAQAQEQAVAYIGEVLRTQVGYWGYIDVFFVLMLLSGAAVPLALILRNVDLGRGKPASGH